MNWRDTNCRERHFSIAGRTLGKINHSPHDGLWDASVRMKGDRLVSWGRLTPIGARKQESAAKALVERRIVSELERGKVAA